MPGHATGSRIGRVGFGGARGCPQRAKVSMTMTGQTALAASDASYSPYTSTFAGVTLITSAGVTCTGRYAEKMRPILPACLRLKPLFRNWSSIISPSTRS